MEEIDMKIKNREGKELTGPYQDLAMMRQTGLSLTLEDFVIGNRKRQCFLWDHTPEGGEFWDEVWLGNHPSIPQTSLDEIALRQHKCWIKRKDTPEGRAEALATTGIQELKRNEGPRRPKNSEINRPEGLEKLFATLDKAIEQYKPRPTNYWVLSKKGNSLTIRRNGVKGTATWDGKGRNSPMTALAVAALKALNIPHKTIEQMMKDCRKKTK